MTDRDRIDQTRPNGLEDSDIDQIAIAKLDIAQVVCPPELRLVGKKGRRLLAAKYILNMLGEPIEPASQDPIDRGWHVGRAGYRHLWRDFLNPARKRATPRDKDCEDTTFEYRFAILVTQLNSLLPDRYRLSEDGYVWVTWYDYGEFRRDARELAAIFSLVIPEDELPEPPAEPPAQPPRSLRQWFLAELNKLPVEVGIVVALILFAMLILAILAFSFASQ